MKTLGQLIKEYREKNKMTALELAEKLEVSQVFVTLLENDKRKISKKVMNRLSVLMSEEEMKTLVASEEYHKTPETIKKKLIDLEKENEKLKLNSDPRIKDLKGREKLQYEELLNQNALFFNDESISEEDKKKMVDALTEAFYAIKKSNKRTK